MSNEIAPPKKKNRLHKEETNDAKDIEESENPILNKKPQKNELEILEIVELGQ